MDRLSINLSDYAHAGDGYGRMSTGTLDELNKALAANQMTGRDTTDRLDTSGAPLKVESLEKTLKHLTFRESDITFWKDIPKMPAYNTVVEFNQQVSYGQDRGGFYNEGELPDEEDSIYARRAQFTKYLGVTKSVTHQMTLVNSVIGNIIQKTIQDGTLWILRKLDQSLFFGNDKLIDLEFNGFIAQQENSDSWANRNTYFSSDHVVDLRGSVLTEEAIEKGANTIVESYGLATQLYTAPSVLSGFVKNFYGNKFIMPNTQGLTNGIMGQRVQQFESQFGPIGLRQDVFFKKKPSKTSASVATSDKAPVAPTVTATAVAATAANSLWTASEAGNYMYAVSAFNRYGESALTIVSAAVAVVENGAVDLTITAGTGSVYAPTAYRIYRSLVNGTADSEFYPIMEVSLDDVTRGLDGGAEGNIRDLNRFLPNCDQALLLQFDDEVINFAQLAPLMKMDLAMLAPAYRFMILLYGTPLLYAPKKMVRLINIGSTMTA